MLSQEEIETELCKLQHGTPNERFRARKSLAAVADQQAGRLIEMLPAADASALADILGTLEGARLRQPGEVSVMVQMLRHGRRDVRAAAARVLLRSSPKLGGHLHVIRDVRSRETVAGIGDMLQKLLDRYPHG